MACEQLVQSDYEDKSKNGFVKNRYFAMPSEKPTREGSGGPAFPSPGENHPVIRDGQICWERSRGMSLRDYFAAQALAGRMASGGVASSFTATECYTMADKMLEAREGK